MRTPHVEADYHLPLRPGTNVAVINALAHVVVTEGLVDEALRRASAASPRDFERWRDFVAAGAQFAGGDRKPSPACRPADLRAAARLYATGGNAAIYYGLGVTEHSQGSTMVMGMANLAMATGNLGRVGVGVNPLRGQNNVQGSCDMGSFPHEFSGYRHVSDDAVRAAVRGGLGRRRSQGEPGLRIPNMFDAAVDGTLQGPLHPGRGHRAVRPRTRSTSRPAWRRWNASSSRTSS